ncbi:MAG: hypothetical protein HRT61_01390 [Ekhidna sp.]|nr:hypothetical protein [Ekhidna sp.]
MRTYTELTSNVKSRMENFSTDVENYLPTAVFLAETRVAHDAGYERIDVVDTRTLEDDDRRFVAEFDANGAYTGQSSSVYEYYKGKTTIDPDDFLYFNNVWVETRPNTYKKLIRVDMSFIHEYLENTTAQNVPKYYSYEEGDPRTIFFAPAATTSQITATRIDYARRPERLSTDNPTNVLLTKLPNLLFTAVISEIAKFTKDDLEYNQAEQDYAVLLQSHMRTMDKEDQDVATAHQDGTINTQG